MAKTAHYRKVFSHVYDGENGVAMVAEIFEAEYVSGGTGSTPLLFNIGNGQYEVNAGERFSWVELPAANYSLPIDAHTVEDDPGVYGQVLGDVTDLEAQLAALEAEVSGLAGGGLLVQRITGTTDGSGNVTLSWPQAFSGTPVVALALETSNTAMHSARITANSGSSTSVNVTRAPTVTVLSINVLGATVAASGVTVHALGAAPL